MSDRIDFKNAWCNITREEKDVIFDYCSKYMDFLNRVKTEREFIDFVIPILEKNGFVNIESYFINGRKLIPGDKVYQNVHGKSLLCAVIGIDAPQNGFNLIGSHIDSPRLDFKQNPIYEENETVYAKTHYYGGIKKYQWLAIPLALHGVVITKSGEAIKIAIGENESEPCFTITDLLPHLAQNQMKKSMSEAVLGESLNIILGSTPEISEFSNEDNDRDSVKNAFKSNILKILKDKYNIDEQDFISAEIEAVPAYKARDIGIDRAIIGAYGQDDRVCAFTSLSAIFDISNGKHQGLKRTAVAYFSDKEEVGSMGNTGAQSKNLENFMFYLCNFMLDNYSELVMRKCISSSHLISADVVTGVDANFDVQDKKNASYLGYGAAIEKYTGSRGKAGASDANPEFIAKLRNIFDKNGIYWQTGELGKVDLGGGGTIAQYMANMGIQVIDCGVPVLSMHSPFELVSKADVYYTYKAYLAFYNEYAN